MSDQPTSPPPPPSPSGSLLPSTPSDDGLPSETSLLSLQTGDDQLNSAEDRGEASQSQPYRVPKYASRDFSFLPLPRTKPEATRWRMEPIERNDEEGGYIGQIRSTLTVEPSELSTSPIPSSQHFVSRGFDANSEEHQAFTYSSKAWNWAYPDDNVYLMSQSGPAILDHEVANQALWQFTLAMGDAESLKKNGRVLVRPWARDHADPHTHGPIVLSPTRTLGCITQSVDSNGVATGAVTKHRGIVFGRFYPDGTTYQPVPSGVFSHDAPFTDPPTVIVVESSEPLWVMLPYSKSSVDQSETGTGRESVGHTDNQDADEAVIATVGE